MKYDSPHTEFFTQVTKLEENLRFSRLHKTIARTTGLISFAGIAMAFSGQMERVKPFGLGLLSGACSGIAAGLDIARERMTKTILGKAFEAVQDIERTDGLLHAREVMQNYPHAKAGLENWEIDQKYETLNQGSV